MQGLKFEELCYTYVKTNVFQHGLLKDPRMELQQHQVQELLGLMNHQELDLDQDHLGMLHRGSFLLHM